ncbi:N-acetylmuramidase domain-containing protein [Pararhizobium mangrovi]|uniref:DUF3380 domain-containing protein n=1 Tax=Pararhizobium mangrovi TaxID=2590452 RepID=A0A506UCM1_9HYPH|nr:N-acetylmuramidase domain-containing protein [Pararhizobium mangrovi]TPW30694.1 DUF3380 domain-containing protein [Pararhizobium mangrovi]
MMDDEARRTIAAAARMHGLEPAALEAVVAVESGGRVTTEVDGRREPLIRWEGHYFDRLCRDEVRAAARKAGLCAAGAGVVANPPGQAARWSLLRRAAKLDRAAAYESASWGVGQVMGAHWRALGYGSVEAFVEDMRAGLAGQLRGMLAFIADAGLMAALARKDWTGFARGYNGPGFRRNAYARKLREAYEAACAGSGAGEGAALLKRGSRGPAVTRLQQALASQGAALEADGIFGSATVRAVKRFQHANDLAADGIAGPRTLAALKGKRSSVLSCLATALSRLAACFGIARTA